MRQWTVDAFAEGPFRGNPACVVQPFEAWPADAWMQSLAAENNQAETAYLTRTEDPGRFGLRWFTPALEVPLCGHATLAAAHVLFEELDFAGKRIVFETQSGDLAVTREATGYAMDFPADPLSRTEAPAGLAEALGAEPAEVWRGRYLVAVFNSPAAIVDLRPDTAAIARLGAQTTSGRGNLGVAAIAEAGSTFDVIDRFFAPGSGIPEDPATGSLHCALAPLFMDKLGRRRLRFRQAYPGRGGDLDCEVAGERVILRGKAVTVVESVLRVAP